MSGSISARRQVRFNSDRWPYLPTRKCNRKHCKVEQLIEKNTGLFQRMEHPQVTRAAVGDSSSIDSLSSEQQYKNTTNAKALIL